MREPSPRDYDHAVIRATATYTCSECQEDFDVDGSVQYGCFEASGGTRCPICNKQGEFVGDVRPRLPHMDW